MPCPSDLVNGSCTVTLPWHLAICCGMPVTLHLCILPSILGRGCPVRKWSGIDFFWRDERCKPYCFIACKDTRTPLKSHPARARHQGPLKSPSLAPAALLESCVAPDHIATQCSTTRLCQHSSLFSQHNPPVQPVQNRQAQGPLAQPPCTCTQSQPASNRRATRPPSAKPCRQGQHRFARGCRSQAGPCGSTALASRTRPRAIGARDQTSVSPTSGACCGRCRRRAAARRGRAAAACTARW